MIPTYVSSMLAMRPKEAKMSAVRVRVINDEMTKASADMASEKRNIIV